MPLILLLIAAALFYKFAWFIAAVLVTVAGAILIGKWFARRDDLAVARRLCDLADVGA